MIGKPMTKAETARELGYGHDVEAMDRDHDRLHRALVAWLGVHSYSMDLAAKKPLRTQEFVLANFEEDAVLALQRFLRHYGVAMPSREEP